MKCLPWFIVCNSRCLKFRSALLGGVLAVLSPALFAQGVSFAGPAPSVNFGNVNLCAAGQTTPPCSVTLTLNYKVTGSGTLGSLKVVTAGVPNLDFTLASGSTCTGAVTAGTTCVVNVNFTPKYAGTRPGGVLVTDGSGDVLAKTLLYGFGAGGPQIGFNPGVMSSVPVPKTKPAYVLIGVDAADDLFFGQLNPSTGLAVFEQPAGSSTLVAVTPPLDFGSSINNAVIDGAGDIIFCLLEEVLEIPAGSSSAIQLPFKYLLGEEHLSVTLDAAGDIFVLEPNNNAVDELPVGSGTTTTLNFGQTLDDPLGLGVDPSGNVFVVNYVSPTNEAESSIVELPAGGGPAVTLPVGLNGRSESLGLDGLGNLFTSDASGLVELPTGGNALIPVAAFSSNFDNPVAGPAADLLSNVVVNDSAGVFRIRRNQSPPLTFAATPIGATATLPLTIANIGTGTLTATPSFNSPYYKVLSMVPANCLAGTTPTQPCTLQIGFSPLTDGQLNAALTLETNSANNPVVQLIGTASGVDTPVLSLPSGIYTTAQSVTITDAQPGAAIHYTTNGSLPTSSSPIYSSPIAVTSTERLTAVAIAAGTSSPAATAAYTIASTTPANFLNFGQGFAQASQSMQFNGHTRLAGSSLQLTDGGLVETASAFSDTAVNVQSFTTNFTFQITNALADGFTFAIQGGGPTALGATGGYLGYEGIPKSVAIKFDLHNNDGEGTDSTGLYINGAPPTIPAIDLTGSGIDLHSGDAILAQITYNGTTLILTLTDTVTSATWVHAFSINIPATVGGSAAFVGFTGATGGLGANQEILSWTYAAGAPAPPTLIPSVPQFSGGFTGLGMTTNGSASYSGTSLQLSDGGFFEASSAFYNNPVKIQSFTSTFTFNLASPGPSAPLPEIADGITFTIQGVGATAIGKYGKALGYAPIGKSVAIKFDTHDDAGEGPNSTGFYVDGALPTVPSLDLNAGYLDPRLNLHSGDTFQAVVAYDGTNLTLTLTDPRTGSSQAFSTPIDIPTTVGGNTAYVGFTGSTGADTVYGVDTAIEDVLTWTFTNP